MAKTIDERYLIKFYEMALSKGNWDVQLNVFDVGRAFGKKETATRIIIRNLYQANFLKKSLR